MQITTVFEQVSQTAIEQINRWSRPRLVESIFLCWAGRDTNRSMFWKHRRVDFTLSGYLTYKCLTCSCLYFNEYFNVKTTHFNFKYPSIHLLGSTRIDLFGKNIFLRIQKKKKSPSLSHIWPYRDIFYIKVIFWREKN